MNFFWRIELGREPTFRHASGAWMLFRCYNNGAWVTQSYSPNQLSGRVLLIAALSFERLQ